MEKDTFSKISNKNISNISYICMDNMQRIIPKPNHKEMNKGLNTGESL